MSDPIVVAPADPGVLLRQMAMRSSRALYAAAELKLADHLAGGAMASADLAALTSTHPNPLHRLLRALAAAGVFTEGADGRFALTETGARLRADHPRSMRAGVLFLAGPQRWERWSGVMRSPRTGAPAIERAPGIAAGASPPAESIRITLRIVIFCGELGLPTRSTPSGPSNATPTTFA